MGQFRLFLNNAALKELHLSGRLFTWSNERTHPTLDALIGLSSRLIGSYFSLTVTCNPLPLCALTTRRGCCGKTLKPLTNGSSSSRPSGPSCLASSTSCAQLGNALCGRQIPFVGSICCSTTRPMSCKASLFEILGAYDSSSQRQRRSSTDLRTLETSALCYHMKKMYGNA